MKYSSQILFSFFIVLFVANCGDEPKRLGTETMGEFAPPDAFLEGETHPYYGSENEWNQRFFYEHAERFYKRRGQRAMLELMKGKFEEAEEYCRDLLNDDPNDLEALFNLSIALAQKGNPIESMEVLKESIQKGLPLERYLAGPRDILQHLYESVEFKKYIAGRNIQLLHGPMVGRVTDNSACIWVRTLIESDVQIRASHSSSMSKAKLSNIQRTGPETDYTTVVLLEDLEPHMVYYYEVLIDGRLAERKIHQFSTFPSKGTKVKYSLGFGGGAGYVPVNERMWSTIRKHQLEAFLWMGDNVYINMPEFPNALHDYTYYRRQSRSDFRKLVSSLSNYAIWDDHDAATDDVWLGPYKDKPPWKMPLLEKFKQNWINPFYGTEDWPGVYFNFNFGDVEIFMLDGRIYRTNPFDENPTMLGPAQKEWLKNSVRNSNAVFKVIASPVPWSFESKKDAKDTWNGFQEEREELFDYFAENEVDGIILISADRHRSDAWEIKRPNGYSLFEFSSSRLTNQHFHPLVEKALFGYNERPSFGKLSFDMTSNNPKATFEIFNIDNEKINSLTITKEQLTH